MPDRNLGLWANDASLQASIAGYSGTGYTAGSPARDQFVHAVAMLMAERIAGNLCATGPERSIFLLGPPPDASYGGRSHCRFKDGLVASPGHVWFGRRFESAYGLQLPVGSSDDDCFDFISAIDGASGYPALWYDPQVNPDRLSYYENGLRSPDECRRIELFAPALTIEAIKRLLDEVHRAGLHVVPNSDLASHCWKDGPNGIPCEKPEKSVQRIVRALLRAQLQLLGRYFVPQEHTTDAGRCDLLILQRDAFTPSVQHVLALLELKVVRSLRASGNKVPAKENIEAVQKGVRQARTYCDDHKAHHAILCCYDMRLPPDPQEALSHGLDMAKTLGVIPWAWPMYGDPESYRQALVAARTASNDDGTDSAAGAAPAQAPDPTSG